MRRNRFITNDPNAPEIDDIREEIEKKHKNTTPIKLKKFQHPSLLDDPNEPSTLDIRESLNEKYGYQLGEKNTLLNVIRGSDGKINIPKLPIDLLAMTGSVALVQKPLTKAIIAGSKKAKGDVGYPGIIKEMSNIDAKNFKEQSDKIFKRRMFASVIPIVSSEFVREHYGLTRGETNALVASAETLISSTYFKESAERFKGANASIFPLIDTSGKPVNLLEVKDYSQFKSYCANNPLTKSFSQDKWKDLQVRQANYGANILHQTGILMVRVVAATSSIYKIRDWTDQLAEKYESEFTSLGLNKKQASLALNAIAIPLNGWVTAPLDKLFTQVSSGEKPAKEVFSIFFKEATSKDFTKLFNASVARSAVVSLAVGSLIGGLEISKSFRSWVRDYEAKNQTMGAEEKIVGKPRSVIEVKSGSTITDSCKDDEKPVVR